MVDKTEEESPGAEAGHSVELLYINLSGRDSAKPSMLSIIPVLTSSTAEFKLALHTFCSLGFRGRCRIFQRGVCTVGYQRFCLTRNVHQLPQVQ